jgi:hypothetical protein
MTNLFTPQPNCNTRCALGLVRRGVPVFPCKADKSPRTASGFKDATTDEIQVKHWWRRWPDALVGTPTGVRFDVVDVDLAKHPEAEGWLYNAELPETRTHHTRSGGLHFLFKPTPGLTNSASKLAPGVDIRARGGYIIWWPAQGLKVSLPNILAEMPEKILEELKRQPKPTLRALAREVNWAAEYANELAEGKIDRVVAFVAAAPEGERSNRLYWAARRFVEMCDEGLVDESYAQELLLEAARYAGHPDHRSHSTIESAFKAGRQS